MMKKSLYIVQKTLDEPTRIVGLTLDEFIPAALMALILFLAGNPLSSLVVGLMVVVAMRIAKKGQGASWLLNLMYWYLPKCFMKYVLPKTPASENREYIA